MTPKNDNEWDIDHLHNHLQSAAYLEAWTIPYYMSAMLSIVSRSTLAYQLIQSVVHQEMLHLQLVANIANAYDYSPVLDAKDFSYASSEKIPHLNFNLDPDNPTRRYAPYSVEIGPLDERRINAMCLIEYPEWSTGEKPVYRDTVTEYGSIGEFYDALEYGARQLRSDIVGGVRQVDMFSAFYRKLPQVKVESSGAEGLAQVQLLIDVIRDQGEAAKVNDAIHPPHRNTADDPQPACSHYDKFCQIRSHRLPKTYPVKDNAKYTRADHHLQQILVDNFARFTAALNKLFAGGSPDDFAPLMVTIGASILTCWKNGVTPKFTNASPMDMASIVDGDRRVDVQVL
jgi:Ferritin-like